MAELKSFQEYAAGKELTDKIEAALRQCADSQTLIGGNDHLSELIEEFSLEEEESLSKESLMSTVAGALDPGNRIWKQILEKNEGKLP